MKTAFALLTAAALLPAIATAGPESIIKQRAKELNNQNNVRQGVPPPTQPTQPAATPGAPAAPTISPALTRFQSDLAAITANSAVTPETKQKLAQELLAGAQGTKPSAPTASKLAEDIAAACAEKPLSFDSRARLVRELDAVLNPGKYPQAKLDGIFADIQAIFQANGLNRTKAEAISQGVKSLASEARGAR
jgi:hypothetical protein